MDGGATWYVQYNDYTHPWKSIHFKDNNTGYAFGLYNSTMKTTNGGALWTDVAIHDTTWTAFSLFNGFVISSDTCFALTEEGRICRTTDGGLHWSINNIGVNGKKIIFVNSSIGYIVGGGGTILKSIDGGISWLPQISGTINNLLSVSFTDANKGYVVGDNGTILNTMNGGMKPPPLALPPPDPNLSTLSGNTQYIIYPNPARDKVTIKSAEIPIQNRLILLNFNGQEILRKEISDQKTTININMLPSGVYLLKLISNKAVETRKLLKE